MESEKAVRLVATDDGSIEIPASVSDAAGIGPGDQLVVRVENGCIFVESRQHVIRELREHYRSLSDVSLADELLRERREEARKEYAELGIPFPDDSTGRGVA